MKQEIIDNPRYPHHIMIIRKVVGEWLSEGDGEESEVVIYEGLGRSYTDTTTTGDSVIDSNKRKASIPMRFSDWVAQGETEDNGPLIPMSGDMLFVTKGSITEEWEVKDFEPDNNRSVVYGQLNRTINV